jgi:hypothetical protein
MRFQPTCSDRSYPLLSIVSPSAADPEHQCYRSCSGRGAFGARSFATRDRSAGRAGKIGSKLGQLVLLPWLALSPDPSEVWYIENEPKEVGDSYQSCYDR